MWAGRAIVYGTVKVTGCRIESGMTTQWSFRTRRDPESGGVQTRRTDERLVLCRLASNRGDG
jgi:hypothetical protein